MLRNILAVAAAVMMAGAAQAQTIELRFATSVANVEEPSYKAMETFAQRVEERSGGRLDITIFIGEQLGAQKKVNEMIMAGAALMNMTDYGQLGQFSPDLGLVAGPYIYGSLEDANRLFDPRSSPRWRTAGRPGHHHRHGQRPLRIPPHAADRPIRTPPTSPDDGARAALAHPLEAFRALGARPTEIAWGEVYNALQSNVVNAAEAPYASIYGSKLNEVRKYVSRTSHQIMFTTWVISTSFFESLPPDLQQILLEEGDRIADELTAATLAGDAQFEALLVESGVEIISDVDVPAFQELTKAAYDVVPNLTPGILDRMREAMQAE